MKTIVTHISPDLDAITSVWLIVRFLQGWDQAELQFVPAGTTLNSAPPDEDPDIIHVDTGLGKFDHHQLTERTSAASKVYDYIQEHGSLRKSNIEALERIIDVVTLYDNFGEVHLTDPASDIYNFSLNEIIYGMKSVTQNNHHTVLNMLPMLDALLINMKVKVSAESELNKGVTLQTRWGRTLIVESSNDEVLKLGLKSGYTLVARRDPEREYIRIKSFPNSDYDLTPLYEIIKKKDSKASWYLHSSKNMLLNGNYQDGETKKPSRLSLSELIAIITKT
ncbi:MAG: chromate resistance protein ChrB domain-containing protein [Patescibacteria group bacterium]